MIAIVDYGLGNVRAIANIYNALQFSARIVSAPADLAVADKVIVPGVGAFDSTMTQLNASGLRGVLEDLALNKKIPVLGICVGMQMMARGSEEGALPGLGWIDGFVKRFDDSAFTEQTHLPHMGWNDVSPRSSNGLFRELADGARFYFLHSYYFVPDRDEDILASTDYNGAFASSVGNGNIYGAQFHPEKSHKWGIQLLRNFAEL